MSTPANFETLIYEIPEPHIARIRLNRAERANAQDTKLLYELNAAFDKAAHDDDVRVIILAAEGKHFSAGHDLAEADKDGAMRQHQTVGTMCGFGCAGAEANELTECRFAAEDFVADFGADHRFGRIAAPITLIEKTTLGELQHPEFDVLRNGAGHHDLA